MYSRPRAALHARRYGTGYTLDISCRDRQLQAASRSIEDCIAILERMGERCDPYIYNERVRVFMSGWTADAMPAEGLTYGGVPPAQAEEGEGHSRVLAVLLAMNREP